MPIPGHEVPPCERAAGHDQCDRDFLTKDDPMAEALQRAGFAGRLVLLVSGYDPARNLFSRTRCSLQVNNHLEAGWAHFSGDNTEEFFQRVAQELPQVARFAWGPEKAAEMATDSWVRQTYRDFDGRTKMPAGYEWLYAGWAQICGRRDVQELYTRVWWAKYAAPVIAWARSEGVRNQRYLALAVRMMNSAPAYISDIRATWRAAGGNAATAFEELAALYTAGGSNTRARRVDEIRELFSAGANVGSYPSPTDITWPTTPSDFAAGDPLLAASQGAEKPGDSGGSKVAVLIAGAVAAAAVVAGAGYAAWQYADSAGWLSRGR